MKKTSIRCVLLFCVPIIISASLYIGAIDIKYYSKVTVGINDQPNLSTQTQGQSVVDLFPDYVSFLIFFGKVDVYAENEVQVKNEKSETVPTKLNVDVGGQYVGGINTGERKLVYGDMRFSNLIRAKMQKSFDVDNDAKDISEGSFYRIYFEPHLSLYVCIFMVTLIVWFALITFCLKVVEYIKFGTV